MSTVEDFDNRRMVLEKNVAASQSLVADLRRELASTTDEVIRGRLEVNLEDVTRQLRDWEYELSDMTDGKE